MPSRTKSSRRSRSSPANTSPNSSSNGVDDGSVDGNFDNDGHHQPTTRAAWPMWMRVGFVVFAVVALGLLAVAISITLSSKNSKDAGSSNGSKNSNNNNNSNSNNIAVTTPTNVPGPTPTFAPSASHPTPKPTSNPTRVPTPKPTEGPTKDPTKSPTVSPTSSPTNPPTASPTPRPTVAYIPPNPVPPNPPRGYFNYDPTSEYGPHRWHLVDTSEHPLREFSDDGWGVWEKHISGLTWNMCDRPDRKQSPKNMIQTIQCDAHHEIRTWCGTSSLDETDPEERIEPMILPHKLSLKLNRRLCLETEKEECDDQKPPLADYPRYSSTGTSYSDMVNWDVKIPGEHTLEGVSFDAEIQMLHIHPDADRVSSIAVMVRATNNNDGYNHDFQEILDRFQNVYNEHARACRRRRTQRQLLKDDDDDDDEANTATTTTTTTPKQRQHYLRHLQGGFFDLDDSQQAFQDSQQQQSQQQQQDPLPTEAPVMAPHMNLLLPQTSPQNTSGRFDPYANSLMPTIFFYRYDGSITEPPCKDITWWVMTEPMIISFEQLDQARNLLFTHADENCQKTSVHHDNMGVARPIFVLGEDRDIQKCAPGSFISDFDKGRGEGKKCK